MECDLVENSDYIRSREHKNGGDFVRVGKGLLDDQTRKRLEQLVDVPMRLHDRYNLPKDRTDFLDKLIQKHIREILSYV